MFLYLKKAFILAFIFLFILFLTTSCMYVINLDGAPDSVSSQEISLNFNRLTNTGGADYDYFESVVDFADYYIAVGYSSSDLSGLTGGAVSAGLNDFVIAKFNKSDLSLVSINNLGGTGYDDFYSLIESDDYYVAVGGSTSDLSSLNGGTVSAGLNDFVIAKFNKSDLSLVSINNLGGTSYEYFYSAIESGDYYITAGYSGSNLSSFTGGSGHAGLGDFVICKFNKSDLSLVSINNLGGTGKDCFKSVIESDGYYIAIGTSRSDLSAFTGGSAGLGNDDFVIAKFDKSDLSFISLNNLGGTGGDCFESIIESDEYYIAVGYSNSDLSGLSGGNAGHWLNGNNDFIIAKFNKSDLSLVNVNYLGELGHDYFYSIIESDGYYVAAGYSGSDLSGLTGGSDNHGSYDFVATKFNRSDLSLASVGNFGSSGDDRFYSFIESDRHYIGVGYSASNLSDLNGGGASQGSDDFVIVKIGD